MENGEIPKIRRNFALLVAKKKVFETAINQTAKWICLKNWPSRRLCRRGLPALRILWFWRIGRNFIMIGWIFFSLRSTASDERKYNLVAADAGVFDKTAFAAGGEVHVEFFVNGIAIRRGFDGEDNRKDIAFWQRFI